jgi:hypothetical protein
MSTAVAQTILQQLGGNRFVTMTGAKNLMGDDRMLQFSIPGNLTRDKSNKVRITLNDCDLYTIETFRVRGIDCKTCSSETGIYFDSLQSMFTSITGLDTHL